VNGYRSSGAFQSLIAVIIANEKGDIDFEKIVGVHNSFLCAFLIFSLWLVMKIKELMNKSVITMPADASAYEAVKLLDKNKIGCLVVVYDSEIVGILTERDLLERVLEECRNPKETGISEVMTKHVIVGKPDMELSEATSLMFKRRVKKLPIMEGNRLVGIVTLTDIARATSADKKTTELIKKLSNMHAV
jgi:CBS domain-containing protein